MHDDDVSHHRQQFATTHWSRVLAAGQRTSPDGDAALAELCGVYWYPLYAFLRRQGQAPEDAADLIQGFFTSLFEGNALQAADPERGRFRSFLLTVLKRFVSKQRRYAGAQKRGGGIIVRSIDVDTGERRYQTEPVDHWTADRLYERRWAMTVLERVAESLGTQYANEQKAAIFEELKVFLTPGNQTPTHADVGARTGMTAEAVKVAVHRMRRRYREALAVEVRKTLSSEDDVQDELIHLMAALRGTNS